MIMTVNDASMVQTKSRILSYVTIVQIYGKFVTHYNCATVSGSWSDVAQPPTTQTPRKRLTTP
jgi:hypothetical protein